MAGELQDYAKQQGTTEKVGGFYSRKYGTYFKNYDQFLKVGKMEIKNRFKGKVLNKRFSYKGKIYRPRPAHRPFKIKWVK